MSSLGFRTLFLFQKVNGPLSCVQKSAQTGWQRQHITGSKGALDVQFDFEVFASGSLLHDLLNYLFTLGSDSKE